MHYVWPLEVLLLFSFGLNRPAQQHQNTIPAAKHERIQTWLRRSLRRPLLTNSYASSFFPRQFRVKPFIASVSAAKKKKKKDTTLKDEHKKGGYFSIPPHISCLPPCSANLGLERICLQNFSPFLYCLCS